MLTYKLVLVIRSMAITFATAAAAACCVLDSLDGSPSPDWLPFDYTTNIPGGSSGQAVETTEVSTILTSD
ncbi:hypothetical protein P4133_35030 [Pseudomonas aeruginosa]|nr:hypothetical protein [Pseudomonas aeruginosa]